MSVKERKYVIEVGEKKIEINDEVLDVLYEYVHTPMSLEMLAAKLGLDSWEEAYEFIKKVPAWIMWTPKTIWNLRQERGSKAR